MLAGVVSLIIVNLSAFSGTKWAGRQAYLISR
jgi:hypothetical protein